MWGGGQYLFGNQMSIYSYITSKTKFLGGSLCTAHTHRVALKKQFPVCNFFWTMQGRMKKDENEEFSFSYPFSYLKKNSYTWNTARQLCSLEWKCPWKKYWLRFWVVPLSFFGLFVAISLGTRRTCFLRVAQTTCWKLMKGVMDCHAVDGKMPWPLFATVLMSCDQHPWNFDSIASWFFSSAILDRQNITW